MSFSVPKQEKNAAGWFGLSSQHVGKHDGASLCGCAERGDLAGVQAALAREIGRGMKAKAVLNLRAGESVRV